MYFFCRACCLQPGALVMNCPSLCAGFYVLFIALFRGLQHDIHIPGTQMTLVFIGKVLLLEGSTTKIEDNPVPGIYIYIYFFFLFF